MAADTAFFIKHKKEVKIQANLNPRRYTEVGNTENRALSQPAALFSENVSQTEVDSMGLQDNRILSIPRHMGFVLFFKSFGLGRAFFFFCFDIFIFSAVNGCQHNLHQLEIRNKKKKT